MQLIAAYYRSNYPIYLPFEGRWHDEWRRGVTEGFHYAHCKTGRMCFRLPNNSR